MKTVNEVSKISGVSIRTLHYYDSIGLLHPDQVTGAGYRLYGDAALERLQYIMLFRELQFSLDEIRNIIDSPSFDKNKALEQQIEMLKLKKGRIEKLISFALNIKTLGVTNLDFSAFNSDKIKKYAQQAKERWGDTEAFREYEKKSVNISENDMKNIYIEFMSIFAEFGKLLDRCPEDKSVQDMVIKLRSYITKHFYNCTTDILAGLGKMYFAGGDMTDNIDKAGGIGTAGFVSKAIEIYCKME
ncbi:HTH-type transcriptional activator mta [bioreactor metagenome]|uniref:HTH-type transcriptional activator mta n=1 Tax=bioreactor metagenome TaxID=1076179 RepID=A0A645C1F7_9ZZZZ|nr:MerR family transcriptional regulator [Oscillospiraceae bacterium]